MMPSSRFIRSTSAVSSAMYRSFRSHSLSRASALAVSLAARSKVNYQYNVQLTYNELRVPESYLKIVYLRF